MAKRNGSLHRAKKARNDEFYTRLTDIEKEMKHYREFFRGKVVYCNCDDARESNFFKFFSMNFGFLGLRKLISTGYREDGHGIMSEYHGGGGATVTELEGDGDFRSDECIELLKEADVVVTNPPFSLFRDFIARLEEHGKKFLVIGNQNAITYKEIFPLIEGKQDVAGF